MKIVPIYSCYSSAPRLEATPGFVVLPPLKACDADIVVVEKLSDVDSVRSDHLATGLADMHKHNVVFLRCFVC